MHELSSRVPFDEDREGFGGAYRVLMIVFSKD